MGARDGSPRWRRNERPKVLDTIYLLLGIVGFLVILAAIFFGGFVLLDFIFSRTGGPLDR